MDSSPTSRLNRWMVCLAVALIVGSIGIWHFTKERLPRTIRIATAKQGGLYHEFGQALAKSLTRRSDVKVQVIQTDGSVRNRELLLDDKADIAIIQGGSTSIEELAVIAPLYPEVVHAIARRGEGTAVEKLAAKRVALGPQGSGMRQSAERILDHYALSDSIHQDADAYFGRLTDDLDTQGAIVTTGFMNRDLQRVLATGDFSILPLDAKALDLKNAYFRATEIPRGLYRENPPIPPAPVTTVATTALLVAHEDASDLLINTVLPAIYNEGLGLQFPTLIPSRDAINASPVPLHNTARSFFNPPDQIVRVTAVMESLAAFKELSVALVAGCYLLWTRWRRLKERAEEEAIQIQKDRLDEYLEKTFDIEHAQMASDDVDELQRLLDRVTEIKLAALSELTHENLRSDQSFSIFILQCGNLISKIQLKIVNCTLKSSRRSA